MPHGQSLEFSNVTKRFGAVTAVSGLTARVEPGRVTGFLGPNGAGKTTTLRILLGLVRATDGTATIGGVPYARIEKPLHSVGAVLEASSFHPGRTAANHLQIYAQAAGLGKARVDEVLGLVGLTDAAGRKVGGYSLGMRQRLGLAYALLGDPGVLVLDEPANGLDPEGIRWMRGFLQQLAREGRTVLVSSHQLAEVQQTADALLIISRGQLVFQGTIDELSDPTEHATVVDAPDRAALTAALERAGVGFEVLRSGLTVRGMDPVAVGAAAAAAGVALSSLQRRGPALEEVFLDLVNGTRVHASAAGGLAMVEEGVAAGTPVLVTEAEPEPVPGEDAVAGSEPAQAPDVEPETDAAPVAVVEPEPEPEPEPVTEATPAEPTGDETPADDESAATESPEPVPQPADDPDDAADAASGIAPPAEAHASFAVASTGIIDIVPQGDLPPDPDEDVEALGEIDEELSSERPWENHVKTESDVEADRFFGRFDDEEESVPEPSEEGAGTDPTAEQEPEPEPGAVNAPAPEAEAAEPEAEPEPDGERVEASPPEPESGVADADADTEHDQRDDAEGGEQR
ncbi:ABC transporter ATP-binding protein [Microbacterium sp. CFH 90308]|uniref:ABC transporter ATP-binding protein n=1 Tax=Microbacterium salsuginis TaxID=2722803 RepID=A0ABX1KAP7_9MICO|nr:ABC transporter ATP-binding protein [Microbacterium sp. CFH 90308]NLP83470.1 ABC transporter ATP-binding protein [Microbacterium sp. CFH 90308]